MKLPFIDELNTGILDPQKVLEASSGEITEPADFYERSHRPVPGGLCDEQIFGPIDDYTCACGKYRGRRYEGRTCEHCGVTILPSSVRETRMAHIRLTEPVIPPCYLKEAPSLLSLFLGIDPEELKHIAYSKKWIVTDPGEPKASKKLRAGSIITTRSHLNNLEKPDVKGYAALSGGEAVQMLIEQMLSTDHPDGKTNLQLEYERLQSESSTDADKARLEVLEYFISGDHDPRHMLITVFPVVPPSFRPAGSILESRYLHFAALSLPESRCSRRTRFGIPERLTADPKKAIRSKGLYQVCARRLITEMAFRSEP